MMNGIYLLKYADYEFLVGNDSNALQIYQKAMERLQHAIEKNNKYLEHAMTVWSDFAEGCGTSMGA